jgi:hypothetical protein
MASDHGLWPLLSTCGQLHQRFTRAFFAQKFVQSQNVTRKKAFVRKIRAFNVDEIDTMVVRKSNQMQK